MGDFEKQIESKEVKPNDRLEYLCGVAREILLRAPKKEKYQHNWPNGDLEYKLSAKNLLGTDDPTFSLRIIQMDEQYGVRSSGPSQYTFNKARGVLHESPLGIAAPRRHTSDEDPVIRKVIGFIRPELPVSDVLSGDEAREIRREFHRMTGFLALEHLYTLKGSKLFRQTIDMLVEGIPDEQMAKKTRQFVVDERKLHTVYSGVFDKTFRMSLDEIIENGVPDYWREAVDDL